MYKRQGVAISECASLAGQMADLAQENVKLAIAQLTSFQPARESEIEANEEKLDIYEDHLGHYLVESSRKGLSTENSRTTSKLLHSLALIHI